MDCLKFLADDDDFNRSDILYSIGLFFLLSKQLLLFGEEEALVMILRWLREVLLLKKHIDIEE